MIYDARAKEKNNKICHYAYHIMKKGFERDYKQKGSEINNPKNKIIRKNPREA